MGRIYISLLIALLLGGCATGHAQGNPSEPTGQCRISFVDQKYSPEFSVLESALEVADGSEYEKAYFAMGCFWGSEALLAAAPGVVSTRVGFTGGKTPEPSYRAIGDHVETVEVLYDPEVISYPQLLQHFWSRHNARAKPIFRQYASAVFCVEKDQIAMAKEEREAWEAKGEEKVLTAILPAGVFYPAEESHQKYYLQQDSKLLNSLPAENRLNTVLATKLNAVSGHAGDREALEQQLKALGIDTEASRILFARAVWD